MPNVWFQNDSLNEFVYWANTDRKIFEKIKRLLDDIERNGAAKGIGKPERLKHTPGWSRRIDKEHRLIYEVENNLTKVKFFVTEEGNFWHSEIFLKCSAWNLILPTI